MKRDLMSPYSPEKAKRAEPRACRIELRAKENIPRKQGSVLIKERVTSSRLNFSFYETVTTMLLRSASFLNKNFY